MGEVKIIIAEESYIIREGIKRILSGYSNICIVKEILNKKKYSAEITNCNSDYIFINSSFFNNSIEEFNLNFDKKNIQFLIIFNNAVNTKIKKQFKNIININDSLDVIAKILSKTISQSIKTEQNNNELSLREKEVLREVTLGKINKEIAESLFISIHTVITHRKNITKKLGIKTVSGLTVYAILNNIISIDQAK